MSAFGVTTGRRVAETVFFVLQAARCLLVAGTNG